jgi:hypothetical protein
MPGNNNKENKENRKLYPKISIMVYHQSWGKTNSRHVTPLLNRTLGNQSFWHYFVKRRRVVCPGP